MFCAVFSCAQLAQAQGNNAPAPEAGLGLKSIQLAKSTDGKSRVLSISLVPEARCNFGDLDIIALDLGTLGGSAELQLTAEVLAGGEHRVFFAKEPLNQARGGTYTIDLPEFSAPSVLGLYLCSTAKQGAKVPCSTKRLLNYQQLFGPYMIDMKQAASDGKHFGRAPAPKVSPKQVADRIYFFRFLIAAQETVAFPSAAMSAERYALLMEELHNKGVKVPNPAQLQKELQTFGTTLGSEPLFLSGNSVALRLPYYDSAKCGQ